MRCGNFDHKSVKDILRTNQDKLVMDYMLDVIKELVFILLGTPLEP